MKRKTKILISALSVMFVAAMIGGGLYGIIPAFFKAKWNGNLSGFGRIT